MLLLSPDFGDLETSYADDSYGRIHDPSSPIVVARPFPKTADVRWLNYKANLPLDTLMRRSSGGMFVRHGTTSTRSFFDEFKLVLREAIVAVDDPSAFNQQFDSAILDVFKKAEIAHLPFDAKVFAERHRERYLTGVVLSHSPVWEILSYTQGVDYAVSNRGPNLRNIEERVKRLHNARILAARSAASFEALSDPDRYQQLFAEAIGSERFLASDQLRDSMMASIIPRTSRLR